MQRILADFCNQAIKALTKVEKQVAPLPTQRTRSTHVQGDLAVFLKPYMLGIMSHLNEVLQDVLGKKSIRFKSQVIRSIGALILQVGHAVSAIAPQVCAMIRTRT